MKQHITHTSSFAEDLKLRGLKATEPRKKILQILTQKAGPLSPDEIFQFLVPQKVDRVTIYRCLSAFETNLLVRRCDFGDGVARYELQQGHHHHHHLICRSCKSIKHLEECSLKNIENQITTLGFTNLSHTLEFFGICPNCQTS